MVFGVESWFCAADTPREKRRRKRVANFNTRFSGVDVYAFPFKLKLHSGHVVAVVGMVKLSQPSTA